MKIFKEEDRMVADKELIDFIESFDLDYHDLSKEEGANLCCTFAGRMEFLASKLDATKANFCEVATSQNAVYTRSMKMTEYAPGFFCAFDKDGKPKAFRVGKFEFLPNDLTEKELAFVQSWFKPSRNDRTGWLGVVELLLSFHFDFPVRIKGDFPKSVAIYLCK